MRVVAGLGLLIIAGFIPQGSQAGNVLLPESSSGNQSSSPSLGLIPKLFSPSKPAQDETPNAKPLPAPTVTTRMPSAELDMPGIAEPAVGTNTSRSQQYRRNFRPTQISHMPPPSIPKRAQHVFTFSLSDRSTFSADDFSKINEKLGIPPNKASTVCTLSLRGSLVSTVGYSVVDGGVSTRAQVGYSGEIVNPTLRTVAVCPSGTPLPQGAGTIIETSGSYIIPLRDVRCDMSIPPRAAELVIKYNGDTAECIAQ